jgi:hypothetical protein
MATATATNGFLRMGNTDVYTAPTTGKLFQPLAVTWAAATAAGNAFITDADGVTVCMLSVGAANNQATLDGHFWGEARPWKTPITATVPTGKLLIPI